MPMINPFDAFSISDLSEAINIIPNNYGLLQQRRVFPVKGHATDSIAIEEKNGVLSMIPSVPDGGVGVVGSRGRRKVRTFRVPQLVFDDHVSPKDVRGLRNFGGNQQMALAELLNDKLESARSRHDITLEFLRMGALKGQIIDGDGSTVLYDLFDEFGITKKVIDFKLSAAGTNVKNLCLGVKRHIEDNLMGERMTGVHCLVSGEFFDALTSHPKVEAAYERWNSGAALRDDNRDGFPFGGIVFEEYRGQATDALGNVSRFIDAGKAIAFPVGTVQSFRTHVGPADFNEAVGKIGQIYYAKTEPAKNARGYDIHTQSNVLPLCQRPGVLVELTMS